MVLSTETFNQSVRTEYSEAVNARYTFQLLWVSGGAYRLMEYHLDFNSCVYRLKSGAKNISLNFQMVSLSTKYLHTVSAGARI